MTGHIKLAAVSIAAALMLSSCGGGSSSGTAASSGGAGSGGGGTASPGGGSAALSVRHTSLGNVLADSHGMTVYLLTADRPGRSSCSAQCLQYWPPVPAPRATGKIAGVSATVARTPSTAGKTMATVGGWPLYTYAGDHAPGDTSGEGVRTFGGVWYAVSPSGQPVKSGSSAGSGTTGSTGGGGGGGY
jgi:predicted lipoprotein with Yx(FWY)xxD motif